MSRWDRDLDTPTGRPSASMALCADTSPGEDGAPFEGTREGLDTLAARLSVRINSAGCGEAGGAARRAASGFRYVVVDGMCLRVASAGATGATLASSYDIPVV